MSHLSESEIQGLKNKAKNLRIDIIKMIKNLAAKRKANINGGVGRDGGRKKVWV